MSRVVLVTGAGSGIGKATARKFVSEGERVLVADIDAEAAGRVASEIGAGAVSTGLDVTDLEQWQSAIARAEEAFGDPVGVLVNNAGILLRDPLDTADLDTWRRIIDVNLIGTMYGIRTVLPSLRRHGRGVIVNTGSTAGTMGAVGLSAYSSSKWAVRGLTRTAALELAADNVRVNLVIPGVINTPAARAAGYPDTLPTQAISKVTSPDAVANVSHFLASDAAGYITGAEFVVDGGGTAGVVPVAK